MPRRIGVVGAGLIGGSILKAAVRGRAPESLVVCDRDEGTREALRGRGFRVVDEPARLAAEVDIAFVAVPPAATASVVAQMLRASDSVVVSDTASVKVAVSEDVAARAEGHDTARFVPGHPLAGRESRGWEHSTPDVVTGAVWAVCPEPGGTDVGATIAVVDAITTAMGARALVIGAHDHDRALALTSHMPHLAASALVRTVAGDSSAQRFRLSGGALRDATRVAAANPELWGDILRHNTANITAALDAFVGELLRLRDMVADERWDDLAAAWAEGVTGREALTRTRWASERPVSEVRCARTVQAMLALGRDGDVIHTIADEGDELVLGVNRP